MKIQTRTVYQISNCVKASNDDLVHLDTKFWIQSYSNFIEWLDSDARKGMVTGRHTWRFVEASSTVMKFECGGCKTEYFATREFFWPKLKDGRRTHLAYAGSNKPACVMERRSVYKDTDPKLSHTWREVTCRECKQIMCEIEWGPQARM